MDEAVRRPLILVVDDVEEDRVILRSILEGAGFEVCASETAEHGLQQARQRYPQLIVMDVKLPGISGLEATRRLKSDPLTARIPIIVVTAHAFDRRHARDSRYDALLEKPVKDEELITNIRRLLDGDSPRA